MSTYDAIRLSDYTIPRDTSEEKMVEYLANPLYRICNLYTIIDKNTGRVPFRPNWAQRVVLHAVYVRKRRKIAIPKARQMGFSTLIALILFDTAYFHQNTSVSIVDQTQDDATKKLEKIKLAYKHLPESLKKGEPKPNHSHEIGFPWGSSVIAGKNARGGTNHALHISEWGPIAWDDPNRSTEILTGAMESVSPTGLIFAESTFKGGKGGDWYDLLINAMRVPEEKQEPHDWLVLFFPWYVHKEYTLDGDVTRIDAETAAYLREKEQELGRKFTDGQKLFYWSKRREKKSFVYQEYPTTIEEMWKSRDEGLIFGPSLDKQIAAGKVNEHVQWYAGLAVYSAWDIGAAENTKVWLFQVIGDRILYLEALSGGRDCQTPAEWARRLKDKPYAYGGHFLPHDGEVYFQKALAEAGLSGAVCCERPVSVWDTIADAKSSFSRCEFNTAGCGQGDRSGLAALSYYHSKLEPDGKTVRDVPVHDWSSHFASAFCTSHLAIRMGLLVDRSAIPEKTNRPQDFHVDVVGGPPRI